MVQHFQASDVAYLFMVLSLYFLFGSYQHPHPMSPLFLSAFALGIGSLFFPKLTFVLPIWWLGAHYFRSLSVRSFFATIIGWTLPMWLVFSYCYVFDKFAFLENLWGTLIAFYPIDGVPQWSVWQMAVLGYSALLFLISAAYALFNGYKNTMRTRMYLIFLMWLGLYVFAFMVCQPTYCSEVLVGWFICLAFLLGNMLMVGGRRTMKIFVWCGLVGLFLLYVFHLWMLL
jgi:hypothetical protein